MEGYYIYYIFSIRILDPIVLFLTFSGDFVRKADSRPTIIDILSVEGARYIDRS